MSPPEGRNRLFAKKSAHSDFSDISPAAFDLIINTLKNRKALNLEIYKEKCIKRRIAIRIKKRACASAMEYAQLLMTDEAEAGLLLKVLTIHVSQFFRNPPTFQKMREDVFPYLFSLCNRQNREPLKVWSVGCAGGEEPYTTALILKEHFAASLARHEVAILAADIDFDVLETARKGIYRAERLHEVPLEVRERWFTSEAGKFKLAPEIMNMVTFTQSDLSDTTGFPESDLILCRNVLIYLERSHQERVLKGFASALRSGGVLVLGKAESLVGDSRCLFQTICPVERIYRVA